jgi:hypothetical protein
MRAALLITAAVEWWWSAGMSFHFGIWPIVALVVGLLLTLAWTAFLGYGLFELVEFAI